MSTRISRAWAGREIRRIGRIWMVASLGIAGPAAASLPPTLEVLALTGGPVPGQAGAAIGRIEAPALNLAGDLVAQVTTASAGPGSAADGAAILRFPAGGVAQLVARTGGLAPISSSTNASLAAFLSPPALDDLGHVAFAARLVVAGSVTTTSRDGVWLTAPTFGDTNAATPDLWIVARQGSTAALNQAGLVGAGLFDSFEAPALAPDGTLQFSAVLRGTGYAGTTGTWLLPRPTTAPFSGSARPLVLGLGVAPGTGEDVYPTTVRADGEAAGASQAAFVAPLGLDGAETGVWAGEPAFPILLSRTGAGSPGLPWALGVPVATADGRVAFWSGELNADAPEALWLRRDGHLGRLANAGAPTPGGPAGEVFRHFSDPVLGPLGGVAFRALVAPSAAADAPLQPSLWTGGAAPFLRAVARAGEPAPGPGQDVWQDFASPAVNRLGQLAFVATVRAAATAQAPATSALFATDAEGNLARVLTVGDALTTPDSVSRTVAAFRLGGFNEAGQLGLSVAFTDGTEALVRAQLPPALQVDFATWAQAALPGLIPARPEDDPDGDGLPNLLEYALGRNPRVADRPTAEDLTPIRLLSQEQLAAVGGSAVVFTFDRATLATGLTWVIDYSTDLQTWHRHPGDALDQSRHGGRERVRLQIPADGAAPTVFVRLGVE